MELLIFAESAVVISKFLVVLVAYHYPVVLGTDGTYCHPLGRWEGGKGEVVGSGQRVDG